MKFELTNSFDENLALFMAAAADIDAECANILHAHIAILCHDGDASRNRAAISEFHKSVLVALNELPDIFEDKS